jgi:hypothetical protein
MALDLNILLRKNHFARECPEAKRSTMNVSKACVGTLGVGRRNPRNRAQRQAWPPGTPGLAQPSCALIPSVPFPGFSAFRRRSLRGVLYLSWMDLPYDAPL